MRNYAKLREALLDDLKSQEVMLTSDMTLEAANRLWLLNSFWKKFQDEVEEGADAKCLELFNSSNERCNTFSFEPKSVFEEEVIGEVKSLWYDLVGGGVEPNFNMSDILDNTGVGPGANLGAGSYNFYTKLFDSSLTCTSERLYRFYRYAILANPTWLSAEKAREERYGHRVVVGNRLSYVPKTSEISRSICTEPTLNMFIQKGVGFVLERMLKRKFRIDLSSQPNLNRRLAQKGSSDGSYATIDLSSASDSISLKMLQEVIPAELLDWLKLCRSPAVVYPDGSSKELYMVSSMGNGFTFPLETLLFSTIVVACYRVMGIAPIVRHDGPENFAVFGDDIIVRKDCYNFVCRMLEVFGFIVNDQKSFNTGDFRESCGGDYFRGHDIRGVYCKSLRTRADVYSLINRLVRWSARTGILLPLVVAELKSWVDFLPIPFHDGDAEGIKVPFPPTGASIDRMTQAVKYTALVKVPTTLRMPLHDAHSLAYHRKGSIHREIGYNPDGLLVSFVGGFIRNGRVGVRSNTDRFKIRRRQTSRWTSWTSVTPYLRKKIDELTSQSPYIQPDEPVGSFTRGDDWVIISELYHNCGRAPAG